MGRLHIAILLVVALLTANILTGCSDASGDTAEWHLNQGTALLDQRCYDEAIEEFTKAIEIDPLYADAYNERGIAYGGLGQHERAIEDFDEAIRLNPERSEAYYNRGFAYKNQGKKAEAIADFEKFITLADNPQWIEMARQEIEELSK